MFKQRERVVNGKMDIPPPSFFVVALGKVGPFCLIYIDQKHEKSMLSPNQKNVINILQNYIIVCKLAYYPHGGCCFNN